MAEAHAVNASESSASNSHIVGARLCAKHQPQRVDKQNRLMLCGRAAAGRDDTAALRGKIRIAELLLVFPACNQVLRDGLIENPILNDGFLGQCFAAEN